MCIVHVHLFTLGIHLSPKIHNALVKFVFVPHMPIINALLFSIIFVPGKDTNTNGGFFVTVKLSSICGSPKDRTLLMIISLSLTVFYKFLRGIP